jgi:hypothetical protein
MTVKELKKILSKYDDKCLVAINIIDLYDTFLVTQLKEADEPRINGLELDAHLPDNYAVVEA